MKKFLNKSICRSVSFKTLVITAFIYLIKLQLKLSPEGKIETVLIVGNNYKTYREADKNVHFATINNKNISKCPEIQIKVSKHLAC